MVGGRSAAQDDRLPDELQNTTQSPQQRQHWLSELRESYRARLVTDGPDVEAKEIIVSFGVIQADDYDAALAIARACPPGHTIEIREMAGYA